MNNEEIKALEDRIQKLESVIVYLMCPKNHGVSEKSIGKSVDKILRTTLSHDVARGVNYLIKECDDSPEQVIQKADAICEDLRDRNK